MEVYVEVLSKGNLCWRNLLVRECMIFVVVGTQKFQLNRLLKKIDDLIENGVIEEEVFAQIGHTDYVPMHYRYKRFLEKEKFEQIMEQCDILITHSGVGSIISGLSHHKPVIVVSRLPQYGEHVDDHQIGIAETFSKLNYVLVCREQDDLGKILKECRTHSFAQYVSQRKKMVNIVRDYLEGIKR